MNEDSVQLGRVLAREPVVGQRARRPAFGGEASSRRRAAFCGGQPVAAANLNCLILILRTCGCGYTCACARARARVPMCMQVYNVVNDIRWGGQIATPSFVAACRWQRGARHSRGIWLGLGLRGAAAARQGGRGGGEGQARRLQGRGRGRSIACIMYGCCIGCRGCICRYSAVCAGTSPRRECVDGEGIGEGVGEARVQGA